MLEGLRWGPSGGRSGYSACRASLKQIRPIWEQVARARLTRGAARSSAKYLGMAWRWGLRGTVGVICLPRGYWSSLCSVRDRWSEVGARVQGSPPRKKSQAPDQARVDAILAATKTRSAPLRVAYRLQLTPSELRVSGWRLFATRGRTCYVACLGGWVGRVHRPEIVAWTDEVDSDAEGDHAPFPLASGGLQKTPELLRQEDLGPPSAASR